MKYEIINPSDKCYLDAESLDVATVACLAIGAGQYCLDPEDPNAEKVPLMIFGSPDPWSIEKLGAKLDAVVTRVKNEKLSELVSCLRSVRLAEGWTRTSLNDIVGRAHRTAERLAEGLAPNESAPRQVFTSVPGALAPARARDGVERDPPSRRSPARGSSRRAAIRFARSTSSS